MLGGVIAGLVIFVGVRPGVPLVAGVGFAGSFTTFSTLAFETVRLAVDGHRRAALTNVAATLAVSLTAAGVGLVAVAVLT